MYIVRKNYLLPASLNIQLLVDCEEEYIMPSKRVAAGEAAGDATRDGAGPLIGMAYLVCVQGLVQFGNMYLF